LFPDTERAKLLKFILRCWSKNRSTHAKSTPTVESAPKSKPEAFAVWITGLPACGKSTIAAALAEQFSARGVVVAVLESDVLRRAFAADQYDASARDTFYRQMAFVGRLLVEHGVPVIFDATANRRAYRDRARQEISRFLEVYVDTPLEICMARDPKSIYRTAKAGHAATVPGLQEPYEPPQSPDLVLRGENPEQAARWIVEILVAKRYLRS
jgi:adenylylsulfate kinase